MREWKRRRKIWIGTWEKAKLKENQENGNYEEKNLKEDKYKEFYRKGRMKKKLVKKEIMGNKKTGKMVGKDGKRISKGNESKDVEGIGKAGKMKND